MSATTTFDEPTPSVTDRGATGLTEAVATWCADFRLDGRPSAAAEVVRHALLDWVGVTVAGAEEPLTRLLRAELAPGAGTGTATVIPGGIGTRPDAAAWINGAAAHALDYDDMHLAMPGHPSTPVLAALLATAETVHADGSEFLRAAACGLETELRLGRMAQPDHYESGWHATATLGAIGAAVACCELLEVDLAIRRHAIGLAVSQASGLKSMFGTMTKPTQVGRAAAAGVLSARLAAAGMTSSETSLEDPQGFFAAYAGGACDPADFESDELELQSILFKYHASCYFTHASIEAARDVRARLDALTDLDRVEVEVHPANLSVCDQRDPVTGLQAKFSLTTTTAMALLDRPTAEPATYEQVVDDPQVRALDGRVVIIPADDVTRTQSRVRAVASDGTATEATADSGVPAADLDRQRERLEAKFLRLAGPSLGAHRSEQVAGMISTVGTLDDLGALTRTIRASD